MFNISTQSIVTSAAKVTTYFAATTLLQSAALLVFSKTLKPLDTDAPLPSTPVEKKEAFIKVAKALGISVGIAVLAGVAASAVESLVTDTFFATDDDVTTIELTIE